MGKLLVIEGLDGSGKATQTRLLCSKLEQLGVRYRHITFPDYNDPSSTLVKMYLGGELGGVGDVNAWAASLFYAVDRYASFVRHWQQDYEEDTVIVADRYATSNIPHQMSKLPKERWEEYLSWQKDLEYNRVGIPKPDLVLYLDMPPQVSKKLISGRYQGNEAKRDIHEADFAYLLNCRQAALFGAAHEGWQVVPCAQDHQPLTPQTIANTIWQYVTRSLNLSADLV